MRVLIIVVLSLIFTSWCLAQRSEGDSWVQYYTAPDKILHTSVGFGISSVVTTGYATARPDEPLVNSIGLGILAGTFVGGLKEVAFDHYGGLGTPDAGDFYSTMMGSILGSLTTGLILKYTRKRYQKKKNPPKAFDENWNNTPYGSA